ncbi:hypothetical protein PoB_000238100 [Plakobranchus ocellatus]|uniref:Uncharacterized protein n=1 Tax=Plakobranchus ocellatus TaxID=259542 RepID=A0AAV3X9L1_9GAST|nr:hypothetical protein PoB_000238100 [Plakobranchus ocellatus]
MKLDQSGPFGPICGQQLHLPSSMPHRIPCSLHQTETACLEWRSRSLGVAYTNRCANTAVNAAASAAATDDDVDGTNDDDDDDVYGNFDDDDDYDDDDDDNDELMMTISMMMMMMMMMIMMMMMMMIMMMMMTITESDVSAIFLTLSLQGEDYQGNSSHVVGWSRRSSMSTVVSRKLS